MLLTVLEKGQMALKNKLFLKLMLFYGCRGGELRQTQKAWLDFDKMTWTVPYNYHKTGQSTGRDLVRPVISQVKPWWDLAIALSGESPYVFTNLANRFDGTDEVMSRASVRTLSDSVIRTAAVKHGYGFKHWSVHDLRRTARTNWAGLGAYEVCEKMLGHAFAGSDTYDLYQYQDEMTQVYTKWFEMLRDLGIEGQD
jgi:integrase